MVRVISVYRGFDVAGKGKGMNSGLLEVVKHSTLKLSGHLERMAGK